MALVLPLCCRLYEFCYWLLKGCYVVISGEYTLQTLGLAGESYFNLPDAHKTITQAHFYSFNYFPYEDSFILTQAETERCLLLFQDLTHMAMKLVLVPGVASADSSDKSSTVTGCQCSA